MTITAFLSPSPRLLNREPGGPASQGYSPHSSIFSTTATAQSGPEGPLCWVLVFSTASYIQLTWTSCCRGYIIIWLPLFFLRASQFRTQFNPSTVKVISWYSSPGWTCYLHRCISYFDSLAGVNMLQPSSTSPSSVTWRQNTYNVSPTFDQSNFLQNQSLIMIDERLGIPTFAFHVIGNCQQVYH